MHPLFYDPSQEEEEDSVVSDDRHVRDVHLGEEIVPSAARSLAYSPPVFIFPISVVTPTIGKLVEGKFHAESGRQIALQIITRIPFPPGVL